MGARLLTTACFLRSLKSNAGRGQEGGKVPVPPWPVERWKTSHSPVSLGEIEASLPGDFALSPTPQPGPIKPCKAHSGGLCRVVPRPWPSRTLLNAEVTAPSSSQLWCLPQPWVAGSLPREVGRETRPQQPQRGSLRTSLPSGGRGGSGALSPWVKQTGRVLARGCLHTRTRRSLCA